jgi:ribosomal protein S18 acetylase RimI-like enzyme
MASITPANAKDCPECARLLVAQLLEHGIDAPAAELVGVLQLVIADPALGFLLAAREQDRIVGVAYAATLLSAEHRGFVASLEELYVAPDFREHGIGTALLKAVIERAQSEGMKAVELEVDEGHRRVMSLYQRFGFRRLDRSRWLRILADGSTSG